MPGSSMPETSAPAVSRRDPSAVMRLSRLGSMHQCRLSFMRQLTRRMARENWRFERRVFEVDAKGVGHAVYVAEGPKRTYSLVAFAHDLPDELRSDRVIATAWDATFALHDGIPQEADICRLAAQIPLQEEGRVSERELSVSRANRSTRLWAHVIDALAEGRQPDRERVAEVGYLMRTTAVYGSGKFGAADREMIADRPEMRSPFQAEMLSVYLTRWFVRDLVEHSAQIRNPEASVLEPAIARGLGIGNSTGLGMAPFIVNHPALFSQLDPGARGCDRARAGREGRHGRRGGVVPRGGCRLRPFGGPVEIRPSLPGMESRCLAVRSGGTRNLSGRGGVDRLGALGPIDTLVRGQAQR